MAAAPVRARRAPVAWGSLVGALVALPLVLVATVYFLRAVEVTCHRDRTITCRASETILSVPVWSATVDDIKIARFRNADSGPTGIFAETDSGEEFRLTSSGLTPDQQEYLANAIHQFIFTQRDQSDLALARPPTLIYPALGGLLALGLTLWLFVSAVRLGLYWLGR